MTQSEKEGAAEPAAAETSVAATSAGESSPWAPFRQRAFRWLWFGVFLSYFGTWMETVGAQWLVVDAPNAATLVSLVQAANTLPVMLLALPGGVLADSFDRRWLLFTVQVYFFVVGISLTVLTALGFMPPSLLIAFTFALAIGAAVQLPTWQSTIPDLVPRSQLRAATRLEGVSINLARSAGPALAGLVIAGFGVAAVFALNALSVVFLAIALLLWRRRPGSEGQRERFIPALRAGGRYVSHSPVVRRLLLRAMLFVMPGMALWALLPLIANRRLGLGPAGYGALFGALGVGAIFAVLILGRLRSRLMTNGLLTPAALIFSAALVIIVLVSNFLAALVTLVFAGLAWTAVISTLNAELQLFLPVWVRGSRPRHLHDHLYRLDDRRIADLGVGRTERRPPCDVLRCGRSDGGRSGGWIVLASAGDRPSRPRAGHLLAGATAGFRSRAKRRRRAGDRRIHDRRGP